MSQKIRILIVGAANTGKSTIGKEIQDALSKAGFITSFKHDSPFIEWGKTQDLRRQALLDKKLSIEIEEFPIRQDRVDKFPID